jgi:hypothetical protein
MELWELVARESIRDCIARYNAYGDRGRIDEMMTVFSPDAVMETHGHVYNGYDEIHDFFQSVVDESRAAWDPKHNTAPTPTQEWMARGQRPFIRHYTATTLIDVLSEHEARASSYYVVIAVHGIDHWGRYFDEYGLVDGKWLITKRTEVTDAAYAGGWAATTGGPSVIDHVTRGLT